MHYVRVSLTNASCSNFLLLIDDIDIVSAKAPGNAGGRLMSFYSFPSQQ